MREWIGDKRRTWGELKKTYEYTLVRMDQRLQLTDCSLDNLPVL